MSKFGPYTKKVIECFKNPKNYGKIKKPDGVGKVGNPVCLVRNQIIHVNNDLREINKISQKEKVLSHDGKYNKINKLTRRDYEGETMIIRNKLGKIQLTSDHLILAMKLPKGDKYLRTKNKKKLISGWYHADELNKNDIVLYPISKKEENLGYLKIDIPKPKWDFKSKEIPDRIHLNPDLLKLFGYFLAEGYIKDEPCKTFISFALNISEDDIVDDIKIISKKLFGLDAVIKKIPKRKTIVVNLYSAKLARFFKKLFSSGAENKKIPDFIMNLPAEKRRALICGLWKGDGYVNLERVGPRAGYSTISYKLAQQIKILLLRERIVPSIYIDRKRESKGVKHKMAYRIHVGQRDSLIKLCSILNIKYVPRSYSSVDSWFDENYLYTPITQLRKQNYKGKVYNLEVPNVHSFTSEAFCLHNCGDVMWLYIKVGKNKKGEEIISDIKFETFGCVAAIATSSIITTLAKGKTLEEARKIDKEKIIKSLGGLPPVKKHCSVLAASALEAAIKDYLSKKNAKRRQ